MKSGCQTLVAREVGGAQRSSTFLGDIKSEEEATIANSFTLSAIRPKFGEDSTNDGIVICSCERRGVDRLFPSCVESFIKPYITMGNGNYRPTADFFQNPTMPSEADLSAMVMPSPPISYRTQTSSVDMAGHSSHATTFVITDWEHPLSSPSEWAVLSLDKSESLSSSGRAGCHDDAPAVRLHSLTSFNMSRAWPLEQSWQERDSGMESQLAVETSDEEQNHTLLGLMERNRTSMGLCLNPDTTAKAVELVRDLIIERDKLAEEVNMLLETHKNEKMEWIEFTKDLQVAVQVAERMSSESEQTTKLLDKDNKRLQDELDEAHERQLETQQEMENLRSQNTDLSYKLSTIEKKRRITDVRFIEDKSQPDESYEFKTCEFLENGDVAGVQKQEDCDANDEKEARKSPLTAKGIGKVYVDALEKKNSGGRDQRRIVMSSERNLSRIPSPVTAPSFRNTLNKTSSTTPLWKIEEPTQGRTPAQVLKESLSNISKGRKFGTCF
ncbi:uncharacterized protein LOC144193250 isoform X2 [Stigmatopora nigra]